jgi:hypothetical protein
MADKTTKARTVVLTSMIIVSVLALVFAQNKKITTDTISYSNQENLTAPTVAPPLASSEVSSDVLGASDVVVSEVCQSAMNEKYINSLMDTCSEFTLNVDPSIPNSNYCVIKKDASNKCYVFSCEEKTDVCGNKN